MNSKRPLVSAIIPSYNHGTLIGRAIESILGQEGTGAQFDCEIIVVDDASTDATYEVVSTYSGVKYLRQSHRQGVAAAMNAGIRACNGQYVSILGADDTWLPHKLRVQVPLIEAHPEIGVVYSQGVRRHIGRQDELFPNPARAPSGWVLDAMLTYSFAGHYATLLVRREAFDVAGYFDETLSSYEDYDMSLRLAFDFQFLFEPGPVTIYNLNSNGLWLTTATTDGARNYARALGKALDRLSGSERHRTLIEEAPIRVALQAVSPFVVAGDLTRGWDVLLEVLRQHPECGRYPWARSRIKWIVRQRLDQAASPIDEAQEMCAGIEGVSQSLGSAKKACLHPIIADIWMEVLATEISRNRKARLSTARVAIRALSSASFNRVTVARVRRMLMSR